MAELHFRIQRLETLADSCGSCREQQQHDEKGATTQQSAPCQQQQQRKRVEKLRQLIRDLDASSSSASSATRKAHLSRSIRKEIDALKKEAAAVKGCNSNRSTGGKGAQQQTREEQGTAAAEEEESILQEVCSLEREYKRRFVSSSNAAAAAACGEMQSDDTGLSRPILFSNTLDDEAGHHEMINLRDNDDNEFQPFFAQTTVNDQRIDKALDHLSEGITSLQHNAETIGKELECQEELLGHTAVQVETVHGKLETLNTKLKKTIRSVGSDKLCMYGVCFVLLIALAGGAFWLLQTRR